MEDTNRLASDFVSEIAKIRRSKATVVGLYGDLGSGKTTFTQAVGHALGITDSMQSPTFVIIKKFSIFNFPFLNLYNIDTYRLKNGEELGRLGFDKLLADPKNLIFIEWADQVAGILPFDHLKLFCRFVDENTREYILEM